MAGFKGPRDFVAPSEAVVATDGVGRLGCAVPSGAGCLRNGRCIVWIHALDVI
ncbi:hypothetical protein [Azospirillum endophyticum]